MAAASRKVITALAPFSDIQMDTIGPLPADMYGNKYIINWVCVASGAVELSARPDTSVKSALLSLIEVDCRHGPPKVIRTDQGSQYNKPITLLMLTLNNNLPRLPTLLCK